VEQVALLQIVGVLLVFVAAATRDAIFLARPSAEID
jgi:hypothetical protein